MKRIALLLLSLTCFISLSAKSGINVREAIAQNCTIQSEDEWYGFHRIKFEFEGFTAWVVEPAKPCKALKGARPWTWTMQWAEAFVDRTGVLDLLAEGWHHVTIEAFDTRADEKGLKLFADFQEFLVSKLGFEPKANLVGMSWGGFFSIRYTNSYPQNVRRIYLDAPLLNFQEWNGDDPAKVGPWASMQPADRLWENDPRMPVNMAESIAKAGIPIKLLYGGQDQTVNPKLNCEPFIERFKAAGGKAVVECRGGFGHHPHGVDPNKTEAITGFFKN